MKRLSNSEELKRIHIVVLGSNIARLDEMAGLNNRSAFVRDLIDQEWARRHPETEKAGIQKERI